MRSPFPGMDPYLEASWRDVHASLIVYLRNQLQPQLPDGLRARVEERVFLEWPDGRTQIRVPDVRVFDDLKRGTPGARRAVVMDRATPILLNFPPEEIEETYLQVIDTRSGNRVITCIEVLSPTNKVPGSGYASYQAKRDELLRGGASFVEIDLLRGGPFALYRDPSRIHLETNGTYHVCVTRGRNWRVTSELYAIKFWDRLPVIAVPLREADEDVHVDLQAALDQAYEDGGYETTDYSESLDPPLSPDDQAQLNELLAARDQ
jgi:hypothetical protein